MDARQGRTAEGSATVSHRANTADVTRAVARMGQLTSQPTTVARIEQIAGAPTIYRLEGDALEGEFYGASSALIAIDSFNKGYRMGRDDADDEAAP